MGSASARNMMSHSRIATSHPPTTPAGGRTFTADPSGATTSMGR